MLVLSRTVGEKIHIRHPGLPGGEVVVTLTEVDRNKVRLGFECDRSVVILRDELLPADGKDGPP